MLFYKRSHHVCSARPHPLHQASAWISGPLLICVSCGQIRSFHGIQGSCPPPLTGGRLCPPSHGGRRGDVSISPTCLDVLVQLVNEGIQLLAVLRLQLQLVTGMDPLAQGAGGPRQSELGRRRPGSPASPPPGKLIPFLSPGYSPTDQGCPGQTPPSQSFWPPSLGPVQHSGHKVTPCPTLILKGAVAASSVNLPLSPEGQVQHIWNSVS